jgi:hypothetical protein
MAWECRGKRKYFYRSVRREGRVRKEYYGSGEVGKLAAEVEAFRRAEREAQRNEARVKSGLLQIALSRTRELTQMCVLLASTALLGAGFHRPSRHKWRSWRDGRNTIKQS